MNLYCLSIGIPVTTSAHSHITHYLNYFPAMGTSSLTTCLICFGMFFSLNCYIIFICSIRLSYNTYIKVINLRTKINVFVDIISAFYLNWYNCITNITYYCMSIDKSIRCDYHCKSIDKSIRYNYHYKSIDKSTKVWLLLYVHC